MSVKRSFEHSAAKVGFHQKKENFLFWAILQAINVGYRVEIISRPAIKAVYITYTFHRVIICNFGTEIFLFYFK